MTALLIALVILAASSSALRKLALDLVISVFHVLGNVIFLLACVTGAIVCSQTLAWARAKLEQRTKRRKSTTSPVSPQQSGILTRSCSRAFRVKFAGPEIIERVWTAGLVAAADKKLPTHQTQMVFSEPEALNFADHYSAEVADNFVIGEGSFGFCIKGVHKSTGSSCTVKRVLKSGAGSDYIYYHQHRDNFHTLLTKLRHPNTVQYLDFLMGPSVVYVVMENLDGLDLHDWLEDQPTLTLEVQHSIIKQCMSALEHTHSIDLIHRDVKPDNFRFRTKESDHKLCLLDFGGSCPADSHEPRPKKRNIMGTAIYMAPEVLSGYYTTKIDMWSMGMLFHYMLFGYLPGTADGHAPSPSAGKTRVICGETLQKALDASNAYPQKSAVSLLRGLLDESAEGRLTATQALAHEWFSECQLSPCTPGPMRAQCAVPRNSSQPERIAGDMEGL